MKPEDLGLNPLKPEPPRRSVPPFRRRRRGSLPVAAVAAHGFDGLSAGGAAEDLAGIHRGRRLRVTAISFALHLLLLLVMIGGALPVSSGETEPLAVAEEERPLLTFEAPPIEEEPLLAEVVPVEPAPIEPVPEEPVPVEPTPEPPESVALAIPKAMIEAPSTGFQNDLPFSDGQDEEFHFDEPMGENEEIPEVSAPVPPPSEPDPVLASPEPELLADAGTGPPEDASRLDFDSDAFRERISDPAADARRRADELARREARARAEEADRRSRGTPTDIWRFLEGKRFRNPEGGLVSDRNNTLYYDDRGANMVPWIGRLIAEVRRNWYVPYAAAYQAGHVAIAISVLRSGALEWMQVVIPSGAPGFDNAAVGALRGAELLPLPDDYPGRNFEIMLVFWYNEQPYDLFGPDQ